MKRWSIARAFPLLVVLPAAVFPSAESARAGGFEVPARASGIDARAFPQGLWTLELAGAYADPIRFSDEQIVAGTVGANYYLFDNVALGMHLSGYGVDHPNDDDGHGVGLEAWLRVHLLSFDRLTLFLDGGGGRAHFDPQTPAGGTRWNYTAKVGGGVTYKLDDDVDLMAGARYFHLSNGDQFGRANNPSYDGVQYFVGVTIRL